MTGCTRNRGMARATGTGNPLGKRKCHIRTANLPGAYRRADVVDVGHPLADTPPRVVELGYGIGDVTRLSLSTASTHGELLAKLLQLDLFHRLHWLLRGFLRLSVFALAPFPGRLRAFGLGRTAPFRGGAVRRALATSPPVLTSCAVDGVYRQLNSRSRGQESESTVVYRGMPSRLSTCSNRGSDRSKSTLWVHGQPRAGRARAR